MTKALSGRFQFNFLIKINILAGTKFHAVDVKDDSWGRLTMVEKGLSRPVTRQRAAAPKIHIPAARGTKGARAPEKSLQKKPPQ